MVECRLMEMVMEDCDWSCFCCCYSRHRVATKTSQTLREVVMYTDTRSQIQSQSQRMVQERSGFVMRGLEPELPEGGADASQAANQILPLLLDVDVIQLLVYCPPYDCERGVDADLH